LITTEEEVRSSSYKISKAGEHGAILVTEKWLLECVKAKRRINESGYQLDTAPKAEVHSAFHLLLVTINNVIQADVR
jgi:hypothetical protein